MIASSSRRWTLVPVAVSLIAFANTMPGDFVYDDVVLIEKGAELRDFDLRRIFFQNYWGAAHADTNYRPLTLSSYAFNFQVSEKPLGFHAVNVLLNAGVALLVYLVLVELLCDAMLAALGASLFTVLSIHTEAVANIVGRAELLAGLAIFGAWLVALRSGERERPRDVVAAAAIVFAGLCAKESVITIVPLVAVSSIILRRHLPWRIIGGMTLAAAAYLALRAFAIAGKRNVESILDNPLYAVDGLTRAANALKLLALYAAKTIAPLGLSADYSYNQLPAAPISDAAVWAPACAFLAACALAAWCCRRRAPLIALAIAFFFVSFAVTSNIAFPIGTIFAERLAYAPSFAFPLTICAAAATATATAAATNVRRRRAIIAVLCGLVVAYGARTWARNSDWSDRVNLYLRMPVDSPLSAQSHMKAAEGYVELWNRTKSKNRDDELLEKAEAAVKRSMEIYSESGKGEAKLGEILYHKGRYGEAVARLDRAIPALTNHRQIEPVEYRLRGECYLRLNRPAEAFQDFDVFIRLLDGLHARPDPAGFNYRGLSRALQGKLPEALVDFDRALELENGWPEIWNNRGMCKLQLGDVSGAIEDWKKGLELCRASGDLYHASNDSVFSFLEKISAAYQTIARARRAAGEESAARDAEAEAIRSKSEAAQLKAAAGAQPPANP